MERKRLGTLFFGIAGQPAAAAAALRQLTFVHAAEVTLALSIGLLAVAFVLGFLLPSRGREKEQVPADAGFEREAA